MRAIRMVAAAAVVLTAVVLAVGQGGAGNAGTKGNPETPARWQSLLATTAESASAIQTEFFLKVGGIQGESLDKAHVGEIDVMSFSWGASQTGSSVTGGGAGAGKVSMQDFHFTMPTSSASPALLLAVATGKHFPEAVLTVRKAGKDSQDYLIYTLKDVLVSSYQVSGSTEDVRPAESLTLNFAKIEIEYRPIDADGRLGTPVKACFDLAENRAC